MKGNESLRVQFDIPAGINNEIKSLMKKTGIVTRKDFFNNALTLLAWAIKEREQGRVIASVDEEKKSYREIVMPALQSVSRS